MRLLVSISCLLFFFLSCEKANKSVKYYEAPNGKVFSEKEYEDKKAIMAQRGPIEERFTSTIKRNDSTIIFFETRVVGEKLNPYANIQEIVGESLPFTKLTAIDGSEIDLASLNGKPTLVNLWFINCPPCIKEIPLLNKLQETYGDKVNFVALTFEENASVIRFLKETPFNFRHFPNAKEELALLQNEAYPVNLFLDKNGVIHTFSGNLMDLNEDGTLDALNDLL